MGYNDFIKKITEETEMRKKTVAVLLTAAMMTGMLAGCGNSGGDSGRRLPALPVKRATAIRLLSCVLGQRQIPILMPTTP